MKLLLLLLLQAKSFKNAIITVLHYRPDFAAAWMNLGIVLATMKRYDEALECYNYALAYRKNYPDCYYNLGNLVSYIFSIYLPLIYFVLAIISRDPRS